MSENINSSQFRQEVTALTDLPQPSASNNNTNTNNNNISATSTPTASSTPFHLDMPSDPEISSFYISPTSTTTHSLADLLPASQTETTASKTNSKKSGDIIDSLTKRLPFLQNGASRSGDGESAGSGGAGRSVNSSPQDSLKGTLISASSEGEGGEGSGFAGIADEALQSFLAEEEKGQEKSEAMEEEEARQEELTTQSPSRTPSRTSQTNKKAKASKKKESKGKQNSTEKKRKSSNKKRKRNSFSDSEEDELSDEEDEEEDFVMEGETGYKRINVFEDVIRSTFVEADGVRRSCRQRKASAVFDPTPVSMVTRKSSSGPKQPKARTTESYWPDAASEAAAILAEEEEGWYRHSRGKGTKSKKEVGVEDSNLLEQIILLPTDLQTRAQKLIDRGQVFLQDLQQMESCVDLKDREQEVDDIIQALLFLSQNPHCSQYALPMRGITVEGSSTLSYLTSKKKVSASLEEQKEMVNDLIKCLLTRLIQGQECDLMTLTKKIMEVLRDHLLLPLQDIIEKQQLQSQSHQNDTDSSIAKTVKEAVEQFQSEEVVSEEVKILSLRTAYGYKQRTVFYHSNTYPYVLWRWEVMNSSLYHYFDYWLICNHHRAVVEESVDNNGEEEEKKKKDEKAEVMVVATEEEDQEVVIVSVTTKGNENNIDLNQLPANASTFSITSEKKSELPFYLDDRTTLAEKVSSLRQLHGQVKEVRAVRGKIGKVLSNVYKIIDVIVETATANGVLAINSSSCAVPTAPVAEGVETESTHSPNTATGTATATAIVNTNSTDLWPTISPKIVAFEEKLSKCIVEVDKMKEKRKEMEKKRQTKMEQEQVKRQQAQRLAAEREAKEREKESKAREQKEKEESKLAKQRSFFKTFLVAKEKDSSSSSLSSTGMNNNNNSGNGVDGERGGEKVEVVDIVEEEEKLDRLVRLIQSSSWTWGNATNNDSPSNNHRPKKRWVKKKKPRFVTLPVAVTVDLTSAAAPTEGCNLLQKDSQYTETRLKTFRNRQITLSFHENHRPAYVGTYQKTSTIINGRRPLARDPSVLIYDYDSEAEYVSEDEVSDAESLNDDACSVENEGGNAAGDELEYDGFFVKDGEEDGGEAMDDGEEKEGMVNYSLQEERCGPYYIINDTPIPKHPSGQSWMGVYIGTTASRSYQPKVEDGMLVGLQRCIGGQEEDAMKLAAYGAVLYV
eukprot:gene9256-10220_t